MKTKIKTVISVHEKNKNGRPLKERVLRIIYKSDEVTIIGTVLLYTANHNK